MTEQETKRKKNRKRRRKKRASNAREVQTDSNTKETSDIEEPVTKKIRLDSQEEVASAHLELTSNSKKIINNASVSETNGLFQEKTVSDKNSHSNGLPVKTYTFTDKDLIQLAQIKEKEQYSDVIGRPVITFSISDSDLVHLELVHDKENVIIENFIEEEQIENGQIENSSRNGRFSENNENEIFENIKENEHITNGNIENSKVNGEIIENSGQDEISVQNSYIDEYELEISKKKDYSLRPKSSKHLPSKLEKYWFQRYLLFSLYDKGIMMDEEGWYSVTPEYLAEYIAKRCACDVIIDAMCGVGGNAIQFAMTCNKVIAIDIDETKLHCARNNASIYGVEDKIEFIQGNFYDLVPQLKADVVFLSPPWGGISYLKSKVYDIKTMIPVDGVKLFRESSKITKNIAYYVPRSINFDQMKNLCDPDELCEFQQVIVWEKIKSYVVYYGDLVGNYSSEVIKVPKYLANDTSSDYI